MTKGVYFSWDMLVGDAKIETKAHTFEYSCLDLILYPFATLHLNHLNFVLKFVLILFRSISDYIDLCRAINPGEKLVWSYIQ